MNQPEDVLTMLNSLVAESDLMGALTPRGVPFNLLTNLTANTHLLRVADLYAYDLTTPLSRSDIRTFETILSSRLQEMSISGKYLLPDNIVLVR